MNPKNTKADLKAAREAIGAKDYGEAAKMCKRVLIWESGNYGAWVILGAAHAGNDEPMEAKEAYERAIELDADKLLAWQGLISLHEKQGDYRQQTLTIDKVLPIVVNSGDGNRLADYLNKLVDIHETKEPDEEKYIQTLKEFLPSSRYYELVKDVPSIPKPADIYSKMAAIIEVKERATIESMAQSRRLRINVGTADQVRLQVEAEVCAKSRLGDIYETILKDTPSEPIQIKLLHFYRRQLIGTLHKSPVYQKMMSLAKALVDANTADPEPYEVLIESSDVKGPEKYDQALLDRLISTSPETGLAILAEGYRLFQQQNIDGAFECFSKGLDLIPNSLYGYQCISWAYYESKEFETSLEYATRGGDLVNKTFKETGERLGNASLSFKLCMAHCYRRMDTKYYPDASALYETILKVEPNEITALEGMGVILCTEKNYSEALSYFEKVRALDPTRHMALAEIGWIYCQEGEYEKAIEFISEAIRVAGKDVAEYSYRLGRVYWAMGADHTQAAFKQLMQTVRLDPSFAGAFTFLGHYYRDIASDPVRAKKCYQKAFLLDPQEVDAAFQLSNYYLAEGDNTNAESVCRNVTELSPKTGWAWRRLGYAKMNADLYSDAISCFQKALRSDTSDVRCWEGLAEAYAHEGRYVAALKAFGRATDLDPSSLYAHNEKALVTQQVGLLSDAMAEFNGVLDLADTQKKSDYMPAIQGLGDTYLDQVKENFQQGFFGRAAAGCGKVIQTALRGLRVDPTILGLWKLVGDACTLYRTVPSYIHLCAYKELQQVIQLVNGQEALATLSDDVCTQLVEEFAQLDVASDFELPAAAALDLAYSCAAFAYKQALVLCQHHPAIAPAFWHDLALVYHWMSEDHPNLTALATRCIRVAVKLEPTHYLYWNALGVISMRTSPKISQYAFVKAMEYNNRSAVPWTNYAFLCLALKDYELANQALETAHCLDPEWIPAWVGQAYVASIWGTDAAALFQHAFESSNGSALEASYGYAASVFRQLTSAAKERVIAPAFALRKLTEQKLGDPLALNLHGLLLERLGKYADAAEAFAGAILALENRGEAAHVGQVHANLARALCAEGDYEGAIASYSEALASAEPGSSSRVYCLLGAGIAHYFHDELEVSMQMFEEALNETDGVELRRDVVVLLAKVLWALGGEEQRSVAKQQLMSSLEDDPNHLSTLFTLSVMGMLEHDADTTREALEKLNKVPMHVAYVSDKDQWIPWLVSRHHLLEGRTEASIRTLIKSAHESPWLATPWLRLADRGKLTEATLAMVRHNPSTTAEMRASAYEYAARTVQDAQKAVMLAPWRLSAWQTLAAQDENGITVM